MTATHPLDHLVLPTAGLDIARKRLSTLGFTVAPRGIHPFGTENCCVYFSDGTFMEPLAIADPTAAASAIAAGNVFVARDRAFRAANGQEGFSAVVFGTGDADADHARYVEAGISAGSRLDFSRPFVDASGKSAIASFRLAFAAGKDMAETFVFACERVNAPAVDRTALQAHANGVAAIAEIVAVGSDPAAQKRLLAVAAGMGSEAASGDGALKLPNATLSVLDRAAFVARFGIAADMPSSLRFAAAVFSVADPEKLKRLLAASGVAHDIRGNHIVVAAAPGQGAAFIFEESA